MPELGVAERSVGLPARWFVTASIGPRDSRKRQQILSTGSRAATAEGMDDYDVAVIGGGAAGLSAALVLTRARRRVAVIDAGRPRNAPAAHMQGFLGSDGLPPSNLLAAARGEIAGYGGQLVSGSVTTITACQSVS